VNIVLVSTYELGHQPFGLASPAAWLAREGHNVASLDLAVGKLDESAVHAADWVAFYLPMHTATRMTLPVLERVKRINPEARLACYGLYAPLNAAMLREAGVTVIAGGEFEPALTAMLNGAERPDVALDKLQFVTPKREGLPSLASYARLQNGAESKVAGYTEATRGCKHLCRHCPVVPVYQGTFRVVQPDVVLEDVRQQVAAGAQHITFGDPDFFNGPSHAMRIVEAMHREFPMLTYDATIKIEHLKKHADLLPCLKQTGCLFVTSAVESLDDEVLLKLRKGHTRDDFMHVTGAMRDAGLALQPTFLAFTPWTSVERYRDLLQTLMTLDLVDHTAPVQLALRLLVTQNSSLMDLDEIRERLQPFDSRRLIYPWTHSDPSVERLGAQIFALVDQRQKQGQTRRQIFAEIWNIAGCGGLPSGFDTTLEPAVPHLSEPWYCCAEPSAI
jgi:radical SAM superfamily enzyme YgiQ (UPF0313 family)